MAKSPITESHSKTLVGILNVDTMSMEFDEIGEKTLKELLSSFDGESVKITISLKSEVSE